MVEFRDLESMHKYMEIDLKYFHEINNANIFDSMVILRNSLYEEDKKEIAKLVQWEIDFLNFGIKGGRLIPKYSNYDDKGNLINIPEMNKFTVDTYGYIKKRLDETKNPILIARYAHILWDSPEKHGNYAEIAVDAYLVLTRRYEKEVKENQDAKFWSDLIISIESACNLGFNSKKKIEEIKLEFKRIIFDHKDCGNMSKRIILKIIRIMLNEKGFSKEDFRGINRICLELSLTLEEDPHSAIAFLELGERIDHKLKENTAKWRDEIGKKYEDLTKRTLNSPLVSSDYCLKSMDNYNKSGNIEKEKEMKNIYSGLKKDIRIKGTKIEFDLSESIKKYEKYAEELISKEPEQILGYLIMSNDLLPPKEAVREFVESYSKQSLLSLFPKKIIDEGKNPIKHYNPDEQKYYELKAYGHILYMHTTILLKEIITKAFLSNKLNGKILLELLSSKSIYGKNFPTNVYLEEELSYNWISLIAPSIHEYFNKLNTYLLNPSYYPNLIPNIDSLVLKFEGVFREICEFNNIDTINIRHQNEGHNIITKKDLNTLLYEKNIEKIIDEEDLIFFRYIFAEDYGLNLRNKIAHSEFIAQQYTIEVMNFILLAILRLGKHNVVIKTEEL